MSKIDKLPAARRQGSRQTGSATPPPRKMPPDEIRTLLAKYAPDEPLGPPEGNDDVCVPGVGWTFPPRKLWPKSVIEKRAKFPGYQPGYRYQENMKYGRRPDEDAPLDAWVTTLINHAKAKWSLSIGANKTRLQFAEWMPSYLDDDSLRWKGVGKLDAAAQFLRERYGMPPLAPTRRASE